MGRNGDAIVLAKQAYSVAWCDGPPFAFVDWLSRAEALLAELGGEPPAGLRRNLLPQDWIELEIDPGSLPIRTEDYQAREPEVALAALYVPSVADEGSSYVDTLVRWSRQETESGRCDAGERSANVAIELDPNGHDCWAARAAARRGGGNLQAAAADYEKALELAGESQEWADAYKSLLSELP